MTRRKVKKSRGAPAGNRNALKHGFYSRQPVAREAVLPGLLSIADLDHEIALMRVKIMDINRYAPHNFDLLCRAVSVLHRLYRTRHGLALSCFRGSPSCVQPVIPPSAHGELVEP